MVLCQLCEYEGPRCCCERTVTYAQATPDALRRQSTTVTAAPQGDNGAVQCQQRDERQYGIILIEWCHGIQMMIFKGGATYGVAVMCDDGVFWRLQSRLTVMYVRT